MQRIVVLVAFSLTLSDPTGAMNCETANRAAGPGITVAVCQREYERTRDPTTGVRLADAMRVSGNLDAATAIARGLLTTKERGIAFHILGKIAIAQDRSDDAVTALETARTIHREEGKGAEVARDGQALARILTQREQFAEALHALDECIVESKRAKDALVEGYCRLAAARVLSRVGYFELAHRELDRARQLTTSDRDLAWLEFERGNLDQEVSREPLHTSYNGQAVVAFERAGEYAGRAQLTKLVMLSHLNAAYSQAEIGRVDDAEKNLAKAKQLDLDRKFDVEQRLIEAQIAYRRGNHSLASSINEAVYPELEGSDVRIDVGAMQARIAMAAKDFPRAELWARRGIEEAEKVRAQQSVVELRAWVLSTRREPYELLFATLARSGRFEEAALVLDQWQGRSMLDTMSRPRSDSTASLRGTATELTSIGTWLPVASAAPFAKPGDPAAIRAALARIDLLALVVADGAVFAVTARGGVRVHEIGTYDQLRSRFDRFTASPTKEKALAGELGALIVRDGLFTAGRAELHVLLDGPLSQLPITALRDSSGLPLVAARPIVRILRLPGTSCVDAVVPRRATVIADAKNDLPDALREAEEVAAILPEAKTFVSTAATREALFATARDAVLHVAVHAQVSTAGGELVLYDQAVSAVEISATKLAPALVMLSACGSASARDHELAGSLATAFLAAGTPHVVATVRPVSDAGARKLAKEFYARGGVADPVRALAEIQRLLATTADTDWPSFSIFRRAACLPTAKGE